MEDRNGECQSAMAMESAAGTASEQQRPSPHTHKKKKNKSMEVEDRSMVENVRKYTRTRPNQCQSIYQNVKSCLCSSASGKMI